MERKERTKGRNAAKREGKKQNKSGFLKGAALIASGGFIAKLIGAVYRIPLTNLIGGYGLGLYQMVYPVYCLLLTVSATGIPSSIAKLTAERIGQGESGKSVLKTAMKLFLIIGAVGTVLMAVFAPFLAAAQGSKSVLGGYYTLAPSVFLVSAISVFRGWFQGKNKMFPTAASEITEQLVKVGFGLLFAYLYRSNVEKAVVALLLAVTVSEFVALLLVYGFYRREKKKDSAKQSENEEKKISYKSVLKLSVPVTFSSILLPLSGLIDSVLVTRLLAGFTNDAVTLYGLFAGGAVTIINLPVSVCYGVAAASVPSVAAADGKGAGKRVGFSLLVTLLLSVPSAIGLYLFAEPAAKIVFRSLRGEELATLVRLVKIFSVSAITLSCTQTLSACLTAQGKPQHSAVSMLIAIGVKTCLHWFWVRRFSVFGAAYASNVCYLVAFSLDLLYNLHVLKIRKKERNRNDHGNRFGSESRGSDPSGRGENSQGGELGSKDRR
ncbi:MAG: polysaccharide biosynthesis protein [Clostridia bacterium]|nr:polysaccharide biosynthesis protein [Clostridia bacterium]